jgi:hypothetical protein
LKDCLATNSKGAVAGSNSTESKVFDHSRREDKCGSSINSKGKWVLNESKKRGLAVLPFECTWPSGCWCEWATELSDWQLLFCATPVVKELAKQQ